MTNAVSAPPLTLTPGAVWVIQALLEIELLPQILGLNPWIVGDGVPGLEDPGVKTLQERKPDGSGRLGPAVIDEAGRVHPAVADWFETLAIPDVMLSCLGTAGDVYMAAVLCRRGGRHAAASRVADEVIVHDAGQIRGMGDLAQQVMSWIINPESPAKPAKFEPITVPTDKFTKALGDVIHRNRGAGAMFSGLGLTPSQQKIILAASDRPSRTIGVAATQFNARGEHVSEASVALIETSEGLVVNGPRRGRDRRWWTQIEPATPAAVERALTALVESLPTPHWRNHSRRG